jgi:5'-deoxynucleotidase YfbR-like HD superfamily hydrolase
MYEAILFHDLAESEFGDVPATAKWSSETLDRALSNLEHTWNNANGLCTVLSEQETTIINIVDKLELVLYCTEQMMLGNRNMAEIREKGIAYVRKLLYTEHEVPEIVMYKTERFIEECENECQ